MASVGELQRILSNKDSSSKSQSALVVITLDLKESSEGKHFLDFGGDQ